MKAAVSVLVILTVWVVFILQLEGVIQTSNWVIDRSNGFASILTGSFLHNSYLHLASNTSALLVGFTVVGVYYEKYFYRLLLLGILIPSTATYFLYNNPVIGISGLTYALLWFAMFSGFMRRENIYVTLALMLFYSGGLRYAVPGDPSVAWMTHFFGVITGLILAVYNGIYGRKSTSRHTELHSSGQENLS